MTWVNINQFASKSSVGAAPPGSNNVGTLYRNDVFLITGDKSVLNALVQCWQGSWGTNIRRIWHNGKADNTSYNYNTDQFTLQLAPGDVFAIPKQWGSIPAKCSWQHLVDANGKPWTPVVAAKTIPASSQVFNATTTPVSSVPKQQAQQDPGAGVNLAASAAVPTMNAAAVAAPSTAPHTGLWIWVLGGVAALGGVLTYLHYQRGGVRSNPWAPKDYVEIERVHISRAGYAPGGRYFGVGAPVYRWDYNGETGFVRAANAKEARKKARRREGRSW